MREPGSAIRLAICVPCYEKVDALFAYDLAQLVSVTMSVMPEGQGHDIGILMNIGTYVHQSRQELLQAAIDSGATHVLWLDSDMRFPADAFLRLLKHELPVVGVNYVKRRVPPEFVAVKRTRKGDQPGMALETWDHSTGLEEVELLGFGCVLMATSALQKLPDPTLEDWFAYGKTEEGDPIGEDAWFCMKMLRDKCEQRIFVDHDLSKECGHLGQFEFKTYHAESVRNEEND
jgi:hypothetical protein